jgi:hypothetical protein
MNQSRHYHRHRYPIEVVGRCVSQRSNISQNPRGMKMVKLCNLILFVLLSGMDITQAAPTTSFLNAAALGNIPVTGYVTWSDNNADKKVSPEEISAWSFTGTVTSGMVTISSESGKIDIFSGLPGFQVIGESLVVPAFSFLTLRFSSPNGFFSVFRTCPVCSGCCVVFGDFSSSSGGSIGTRALAPISEPLTVFSAAVNMPTPGPMSLVAIGLMCLLWSRRTR